MIGSTEPTDRLRQRRFPPRSASWNEEMEQRSRRRIRDLVAHPASQGLDAKENGCARISMMARSANAPLEGRIQKRKTNISRSSLPACNARPVHTDVPIPD